MMEPMRRRNSTASTLPLTRNVRPWTGDRQAFDSSDAMKSLSSCRLPLPRPLPCSIWLPTPDASWVRFLFTESSRTNFETLFIFRRILPWQRQKLIIYEDFSKQAVAVRCGCCFVAFLVAGTSYICNPVHWKKLSRWTKSIVVVLCPSWKLGSVEHSVLNCPNICMMKILESRLSMSVQSSKKNWLFSRERAFTIQYIVC